ncbi:hypothetical protein C8J56DRAFT_6874 [Mycena floridula]|nr:hypothetical protein C8J56DRAFT_6874 [Mycena floridula]
MSTEPFAPRINSALFPNFTGQTVRLPCQVKMHPTYNVPRATVESTDGGEIAIQSQEAITNCSFVEITGSVVDHNTLKMLACVSLDIGPELDFALINQIIITSFDERFKRIIR